MEEKSIIEKTFYGEGKLYISKKDRIRACFIEGCTHSMIQGCLENDTECISCFLSAIALGIDIESEAEERKNRKG